MASTFVSLCQPALGVHRRYCSRSLQNFNNKCTSKLIKTSKPELDFSQMQVPPHIDHKPNYNKKNKDKQKMKKHRQSPSPGEASGSKPKKRKHRGHSPE
ncbi:unnamed protein product [Sphagnum troendelagicum]|uniref:Uncharacterized protein n=1 Tax=Sphagnum troendelagicum TaxID=128251 RepID=A0ABP0TUF2_9BRYO